jgi:hypothetical protein
MFSALLQQLAAGPRLLGGHFTAADLLSGSALGWSSVFSLLPERAQLGAYVERVEAHPAVQRAVALDAALPAQGLTQACGHWASIDRVPMAVMRASVTLARSSSTTTPHRTSLAGVRVAIHCCLP